MNDYEKEIHKSMFPFEHGHRCLMGRTAEDKVINMLKYVSQAEENGFVSFNSYKACMKILSLVKVNLALSLTSSDEFIRILAENTKT